MGYDQTSPSMRHLTILLVAASTAALVVLVYHIMTVCWNNHRSRVHRPTATGAAQEEPSISMEHSIAELIPAHKYKKGVGLVGEDGNCAICLSEFEEEEELRTLPECVHSFHVTCIDMWLYSHTTCPICRADNTPSPLLRHTSNVEAMVESHPNLLPNIGVHWGTL